MINLKMYKPCSSVKFIIRLLHFHLLLSRNIGLSFLVVNDYSPLLKCNHQNYDNIIIRDYQTQKYHYERKLNIKKSATKNIFEEESILEFEAEFRFRSEPSPTANNATKLNNLSPMIEGDEKGIGPKYKDLETFFQSPKNRNCLLVGSGNIKVEELGHDIDNRITKRKIKRDSIELWKKKVSFLKRFGISTLMHKNFEVIELVIETKFLVFIIYAIVQLGVNMVESESSSSSIEESKNIDEAIEEKTSKSKLKYKSLEYQFVLINEKFKADGPPPLVWMFNQLTASSSGGSKRIEELDDSTISDSRNLPEDKYYNHAFLRVWSCLESNNVKDFNEENPMRDEYDQIVFKSCSRAEFNIRFPSILERILPVPKEMIEKEGDKALLNNMKRDVIPGVEKFRKEYVKWLNSE